MMFSRTYVCAATPLFACGSVWQRVGDAMVHDLCTLRRRWANVEFWKRTGPARCRVLTQKNRGISLAWFNHVSGCIELAFATFNPRALILPYRVVFRLCQARKLFLNSEIYIRQSERLRTAVPEGLHIRACSCAVQGHKRHADIFAEFLVWVTRNCSVHRTQYIRRTLACRTCFVMLTPVYEESYYQRVSVVYDPKSAAYNCVNVFSCVLHVSLQIYLSAYICCSYVKLLPCKNPPQEALSAFFSFFRLPSLYTYE